MIALLSSPLIPPPTSVSILWPLQADRFLIVNVNQSINILTFPVSQQTCDEKFFAALVLEEPSAAAKHGSPEPFFLCLGPVHAWSKLLTPSCCLVPG